MLIATMNLVDKSTPKDLKTLLLRIEELEEKLVRLEAQNTLLKAELARKDKIIAALQQRHASGQEDQHKLLFSLVVLEQWLRQAA